MKRLDSTVLSAFILACGGTGACLTFMKSSPPVSSGRNSVRISASYGSFHSDPTGHGLFRGWSLRMNLEQGHQSSHARFLFGKNRKSLG